MIDSNIKVSIIFGGATKGCKFDGFGKISGNLIKLPLNTVQKSMKSIMLVKVDGDKAVVSTENENDKYDLNYFCGGGASIGGEYSKVTN